MSHLDENWKSFKRIINYKAGLLRESRLVAEQADLTLSDADFSAEELADINREVAKRLAPSLPTTPAPAPASTIPPTTDPKTFSGEKVLEPEVPPAPAPAPYSPRRGEFTHGIEEIPDFDFDKFYKALDTHVGGAETSLVKHGKDYKFGREHQAAFKKLQSTTDTKLEDFKMDPVELEKIRKASKEFDAERQADGVKYAGGSTPAKPIKPVGRKLAQWEPLVDKYSKKYDVPKAWIYSIMSTESGGDRRKGISKWNPDKPNRQGLGIMQIIGSSFKDRSKSMEKDGYEVTWDRNDSDPRDESSAILDPETNINVGAYILRKKMDLAQKKFPITKTDHRLLHHYVGMMYYRGDRSREITDNRKEYLKIAQREHPEWSRKEQEHWGYDPANWEIDSASKTGHTRRRASSYAAKSWRKYKRFGGGSDIESPKPSPRRETPVSKSASELRIAPPVNPGKITYVLGDSHIEPGSALRKRLKKRLEASGHNVRFIGERGMNFRKLKRKMENIKKTGDAGEIIVASMGGNVASRYKEQKNPTRSITKDTDKNLMPSIADMKEMQDQGVKITVFGPPHAKGGKVTPQYQRGRQTVDRTMAERFGNAGIRYISVYDETQRDIYDGHRSPDGVHWKSSGKRMYGDFITSNLM